MKLEPRDALGRAGRAAHEPEFLPFHLGRDGFPEPLLAIFELALLLQERSVLSNQDVEIGHHHRAPWPNSLAA